MHPTSIATVTMTMAVTAAGLLLGGCGGGDGASGTLIGDVRNVEVTFPNNPVWEDDGSAVMRISRTGSINKEPVTISMPPNGRMTITENATFPQGAQTIEVPVRLVDNDVVDGDIDVTVSVTTGGEIGTGALRVLDDENHITLSLSERVLDEQGGQTDLTVERLGRTIDLSAAMVVDLSQDPSGELDMPASLTIPAGQAVATVPLTTIDDNLDDDDQTVRITGSTASLPDDEVELTVVDDEEFVKISLSEPAVSEASETVTLTLRRPFVSGELTAELTVDAPELTPLPQTVTFAEGSATVSVDVVTVDNEVVEGLRTRVISVDAPGFPIVTAELDIVDDDGEDVFDQFNTIRGVIVQEGEVRSGVQVLLLYRDAEVARTSTDPEGVFAFPDRWGPLANYSIRVP